MNPCKKVTKACIIDTIHPKVIRYSKGHLIEGPLHTTDAAKPIRSLMGGGGDAFINRRTQYNTVKTNVLWSHKQACEIPATHSTFMYVYSAHKILGVVVTQKCV